MSRVSLWCAGHIPGGPEGGDVARGGVAAEGGAGGGDAAAGTAE